MPNELSTQPEDQAFKCYQCQQNDRRPGSAFCSEECHEKYAVNLPDPKKDDLSFADRFKKFKTTNSIAIDSGDHEAAKIDDQATEEYFERLFGRIDEYEQSRRLRR